jgi:hypothetical protein
MLERRDGEVGASHLERAALLNWNAEAAPVALAQLWRRITFSVCRSKVDDQIPRSEQEPAFRVAEAA